MTRFTLWSAAVALAGLLAVASAADDKKEKPDTSKVPKAVMATLTAKFPKAEITKVTEETEDGKKVFDIEFTLGGVHQEADIAEDGTLMSFEKEVAVKDLPAAVTKAVDKKYPKSTVKQAMQVTEVKDKKEVPGGFEVTLETADKKEVELTVDADGKILEDSTEKKPEEKKPEEKKPDVKKDEKKEEKKDEKKDEKKK